MTDTQAIDILIVDDEQGVRDSFQLILEDQYKLAFACNGADAFDMINDLTPRLILLDLKMPKVNGLELLKQIKAAFPKQKVIIVTGYQSVDVAKETINLGASDYVTKPFDSKTILSLVAKTI
ncbi:MAG: YesN/AraC family two-component response regulator [Candidatus Omnitrophota bacterium]|jgi:YesN/AraC family two-component response regulator